MVAACKEPSRQLDTPIGTTAVELDSRSTTVRSRETAIGALIADAMRWSAQTEVAMTNGGGIRGGGGAIRPAPSSRGGRVLAKVPFGNKLAPAQTSLLLAGRAHYPRSPAAVARRALHLL